MTYILPVCNVHSAALPLQYIDAYMDAALQLLHYVPYTYVLRKSSYQQETYMPIPPTPSPQHHTHDHSACAGI